jgi:hypothetical protein
MLNLMIRKKRKSGFTFDDIDLSKLGKSCFAHHEKPKKTLQIKDL